MNRRHLAIITVVIAVPLFAAPLISPVPDYDTHLKMETESINISIDKVKERASGRGGIALVRYQNLSAPAQRLFERVNNHNGRDGIMISMDEAPKPWSTYLLKSGGDWAIVYVHKGGQYYLMDIRRRTPAPSLQAFMLRLGPLLGAIGLGTLAGYFVLTAED